MAAPVLQFKRGLLANLPGLRAGEPGFTTDSYDLYVGVSSQTSANKFFGSHRYWTKETTSRGSGINLVEGTSNGTHYITLASPASVGAAVTYYFPASQGASSSVLTNDGNGNLSWASGSNNATFTGITTFSDTTDNTLGTTNTGAVQINGGAAITKNLTVGQNLNVQGYSEFVGTVTFRGGTINIGDGNTDNINVAGEFVSNLTPNTDNTYDLGIGTQRWRNANFAGIVTVGSFVNNGTSTINGNVQINSNLNVNGNITLGGTSVYQASSTTLIRDKDIVLGVTTDTTLYADNSTDNTANHGGISIASTQGTPLISMQAVGVNSLPDTYKQLMWMKSGTFSGLGTDAWIFNYGVGIGSTQVPLGVRLAAGGMQVTDTTLTINTGNFTNLTGSLTGTISTATRANTVDTTTTSTNATYYVPFVTNPTGTNGETVRVGIGLSVNPLTGNVGVSSILSVGNVNAINSYIKAGGGSNAMYLYSNGDVSFQAKVISDNYRSQGNTSNTLTFTNLDASFARNITIAGIATVTGDLSVNGGTVATSGAAATVFNTNATTVNAFGAATTLGIGANSGTLTLGNPTIVGTQATQNLYNTTATGINFGGAATALVMAAATGITTINNNLTVGGDVRINGNDIQASDGNINITLASNTLTTFAGDIRVNGNDIQASDGNINISMTSNTLTEVKGNLQVTGNSIKSSTGATAITLSANNAQVANDLTVSGNLYVNGNTTQVNTSSITVEDRTIELGVVDGSAPSSTTTWDLGVLFNYYQTSAKKSAVIWEQADSRFKFGSEITDGGGTGVDAPQITFTSYAAIEIGSLWINDCAGQSQVINCSGGVRTLENITIDGGSF